MEKLKDWLLTAALIGILSTGSINWDSASPSGFLAFGALLAFMVLPVAICAFISQSTSKPFLKHSSKYLSALFFIINIGLFFGAGMAAGAAGTIELFVAAIYSIWFLLPSKKNPAEADRSADLSQPTSMAPLQFPPHFPPTDRWGKFFIGVRWLGPDLSFFKELKSRQAGRTADCMHAWHGEETKAVAQAISRVLSERLGWKTPFFVPEDAVEVAFHGPSFDFTDPEAAFDAVREALGHEFGIQPDEAFWRAQSDVTMGQLIANLLAQRGTFPPPKNTTQRAP